MSLKKLCYFLGLTKERREELSDVIYEDAELVDKRHILDHVQLTPQSDPLYNGVLINEYLVEIKGASGVSFVENREEIFNQFEIGDKMILGYKKVFQSTYNYPTPDSKEKQRMAKELISHQFVSAAKAS
jgi:hypothetical protein